MSAIAGRDLYVIHRAPAGDVAALRGLTVDVGRRETVAVLGPSGAGKSTLLSTCAGLMRPATGELEVLGVPIATASAARLAAMRRERLGIVPQRFSRALPRDLSVGEIVSLPLRLLGRWDGDARRRVDAVLDTAGLRVRAGARPRELSGGEQQRAAVCAALVKRPALVLADEPTGQLDARHSEQVVELLLGLSGEAGAAVVIVTHDPAVARRTSRTIHVRDGRVSGEGAVEPVLVVDPQGWLRLPKRIREEAGIGEHVRLTIGDEGVRLVPHGEGPAVRPAQAAPPLPAGRRDELAVAVDDVYKAYGSHLVFDGLSHEFAPGRMHVVAGPSGSGKTTLLDLIAALDAPDAGAVWVGGVVVDAREAAVAAAWRREHVGHLGQHASLAARLTALENVALGATLRGLPAEAALEWLDWVGLHDAAQRPAELLSGGEQRRTALARALVGGPGLIVADEPTADLDRANGHLVLDLLRRCATEHGATVIVSSHDPDALEAADDVLRLSAPLPSAASARGGSS
jgi:ABC-type lipoprotein export system ATPase subunit